MPHQCTNCDRTFDDGSKEMLSGCPNCGGNKFQFKPDGVDSVDETAEPPEPPEPAGSSSTVAQTVGKTAATVKDIVGGRSTEDHSSPAGTSPGPTSVDAAERQSTVEPTREDTAQASARSDIVTPDELPSEPSGDDEHHFQPVSTDAESTDLSADETPGPQSNRSPDADPTADEDRSPSQRAADRPGLVELREELNDQFESVKVLAPGQYELNLMELYEREEYIVALQEDGRYSIQVPENFRD